MGQACNRIETERAGAPLDRVRGAEDGIDDLRILRTIFQGEQAGFHRIQPFAAFFEEGGVETLQVHAHWRGIRSVGQVG
ncbi:hypothetical protein D9M71_746830 [compost metagenome]